MNNEIATARYSNTERKKSEGATYTPKVLANFVAQKMLEVYKIPEEGKIRVLDPACGDGELLEAIINCFPVSQRMRLEIRGFDVNPDAIQLANYNLNINFPDLDIVVEELDFLEYILNFKKYDIFSSINFIEPFDLVIANPPYVRTQILGSDITKKLASNFNLRGKVDLYYPFILGISDALGPDGVAGVITSNRFMTTKSGQDIRREILSRFKLQKVWDLGDTKLFEAAVLPSVFIAHGNADAPTKVGDVEFSSIYESIEKSTYKCESVIDGLQFDDESIIEIPNGKCFKIRRGLLSNEGNIEGVWRISTSKTDDWLEKVESNTWDTFSRIGKIRVGIKSTADKVFLRSDWDSIPTGKPELLKPLITRKCAQRFKAKIPDNPKDHKQVLYPHISTSDGRAAADLSLYPKSSAYLELHKERLQSRRYLIEAGRNWYELWVPQDPSAWSRPKLVFPDISDSPIFLMDETGAVVNGECYWLQCQNDDENDLLWLALAIGNSSFIEVFYDHKFNNKLYAGKRRFITQYVELFPLPKPDSVEALSIIKLTKEIYKLTPSKEVESLIHELECLIWRAFGLSFK